MPLILIGFIVSILFTSVCEAQSQEELQKVAWTTCDESGEPVIYIRKDSLAKANVRNLLRKEYGEVWQALQSPGGCIFWKKNRSESEASPAQRDSVGGVYRPLCPTGGEYCIFSPLRKISKRRP